MTTLDEADVRAAAEAEAREAARLPFRERMAPDAFQRALLAAMERQCASTSGCPRSRSNDMTAGRSSDARD